MDKPAGGLAVVEAVPERPGEVDPGLGRRLELPANLGKFPGAWGRCGGAHNSAPYAYFWTKTPAIERSRSDRPSPIFSGSPALIPDLILPVEVGIGGGLNNTLFFKR